MVETGEGRTPRPEKVPTGCATGLVGSLLSPNVLCRPGTVEPVDNLFDHPYRRLDCRTSTARRSPQPIEGGWGNVPRLASVDVFVSYFVATCLAR